MNQAQILYREAEISLLTNIINIMDKLSVDQNMSLENRWKALRVTLENVRDEFQQSVENN